MSQAYPATPQDSGPVALAPVALFVYNRLDHTRRTVEALQANEFAGSSDLFIFSDAAKHPAAEGEVARVRDYIKSVRGFRSVHIVEQGQNRGLANSIIDGVTCVCAKYGRVIVVEDDLVTSADFLRFMNWGLDTYRDEDRVACVSGYWYPTHMQLPQTFFLGVASSWGWATWSRAWQLFEPDSRELLADLNRRHLERRFDFDGAAEFTRMLQDHIDGKNDSWAIRWDATILLNDLLCLFPSSSRVNNIGFDGSGTHCAVTSEYAVRLSSEVTPFVAVPVQESEEARGALTEYYRKQKRSLASRVISRGLRFVQGMR